MAGKRLIWTLPAEQSLNEIASYYSLRNKSNTYSKKIVSEVRKHSHLLRQHAFLGRQIPNSDRRVLFILRYHLFYKIIDNTIYILDIWDGRRNPESIKYYKKDLQQ